MKTETIVTQLEGKRCVHCGLTGPNRSTKFSELCDERGFPIGGHICFSCIVDRSQQTESCCDCYYEEIADRCPGCGTIVEYFHCLDIPNQTGGVFCPLCGDVTEYFEAKALM